nr:uncharacterized protein LOC129274164 [Lytechinus pictus]
MDARTIVEIIILVTYVLTGIPGNLVIIHIYGVKKVRKISTDYLITALAVADLLTSSGLIAVTVWTIDSNLRSDNSCKFVMYLRRSGALTSVILTTFLSCDRYLIVHRSLNKRPSLKITIVSISVCTIFSIVCQIPYLLFGNSIVISDKTACVYAGPRWFSLANGINYDIVFGCATLTCTVMYSRIYLKIKHHMKVGTKNRGLDERTVDEKSKSLWALSNRSIFSQNRKETVSEHNNTCSTADILSGYDDGVVENIPKNTLAKEPSTEVITTSLSPGVYSEKILSPPRGPSCSVSEIDSHRSFVGPNVARCHSQVSDVNNSEKGFPTNGITISYGQFLGESEASSSQKTSSSILRKSNNKNSSGGPGKIAHRNFKFRDSRVQLFNGNQVTRGHQPEIHGKSLKRSFSKLGTSRGGPISRPRKDAMTRMLLITTAIFFVTSLPVAVFENMPLALVTSFRSSYLGESTWIVLYHLRLVNHVINVFVYIIVNSRFRKDFMSLFCKSSEE